MTDTLDLTSEKALEAAGARLYTAMYRLNRRYDVDDFIASFEETKAAAIAAEQFESAELIAALQDLARVVRAHHAGGNH